MSLKSGNPLDVRSYSQTSVSSEHIANLNNPHQVNRTHVGLANVNNTSDLDKPVSTATQTALDLKADNTAISNIDNTADLDKPISNDTQTALDGKLDTNSVTGSITVVTSVDFTAETVTTQTITYTDGQIVSVV